MKKISVNKSKIEGHGVFVDEDASKGSLLAYITGEVRTVRKELLQTEKDASMHPNWIGISMTRWIDPKSPFVYLNHSCNPSCGITGKRSLHALKDLKAGDEVTIDYSTVEVNKHWEMKCLCGSKECRKIVKSISFLPKKDFKKYYPYLPTIFKEFYIQKILGLKSY